MVRGITPFNKQKLIGFTGLASGELVKDGFFTLFEAVGALEVRHVRFVLAIH